MGNKLHVKGIRKVTIWASNGCELILINLFNVLYAPEIKFNLSAVGCALDKRHVLVSDNQKCELLDKNEKIRAVAKRQNTLFVMDFLS